MWLYIITTIFGAIIIGLFGILKYIGGNQNYWKKRRVPTITNEATGTFMEKLKLPFHEIDVRAYNAFKALGIRNASGSRTGSVGNIDNLQYGYGGMIEIRKPIAFILDPELIKHILVKDFDNFINRRGINLEDMDPYFHQMLFNMEGQPWRDLRTTMSPTFTTGKIKRMFNIFNASSIKFVKFLKKSSIENPNGEFDVRDSCGRFTLDVIASAAFGLDSGNFNDTATMFTKMSIRFSNSQQFSASLMFKFILLTITPKLTKLFGFTFFDRMAMDFFAHAVKSSIRQRESASAEETKREDFLQMMLDVKNGTLEDDGESSVPASLTVGQKKMKLTEDLILAQCVLFFLAGMDTTESLLIFASYELALNPEVQEKLFQEVDEALENNAGEFTYDLVNKMPYLDMVILETLRKYPPVVRLDRRVNQSYKVPDSDLVWEKDTIAVIPVYSLHYDEDIFPNPQKFIPERFTPENKASRHPYTYMPFGLGPRSCIAMRFALGEAKAAIAHLIHSMKLEPSDKTPIPITYSKSTSLKPTNGIYLTIKPRNN